MSKNLAASFAVAVGTPVVEDMRNANFPVSINAVPGVGGSLLVEWSMTPDAADNPGAARWTSWAAGTVTSKTVSSFNAVQAFRYTATTAAGTIEVQQ